MQAGLESFAKRRCELKRPLLAILAAAGTALLVSGPGPIYAADSGVGSVPQGTQSDTDNSLITGCFVKRRWRTLLGQIEAAEASARQQGEGRQPRT